MGSPIGYIIIQTSNVYYQNDILQQTAPQTLEGGIETSQHREPHQLEDRLEAKGQGTKQESFP